VKNCNKKILREIIIFHISYVESKNYEILVLKNYILHNFLKKMAFQKIHNGVFNQNFSRKIDSRKKILKKSLFLQSYRFVCENLYFTKTQYLKLFQNSDFHFVDLSKKIYKLLKETPKTKKKCKKNYFLKQTFC
jgi:hypothetical protein